MGRCPLAAVASCGGVGDQSCTSRGDRPCSSPAPHHAVCKFKAHKRCAVRATNNCKWTTLASIGTEIIEDEDGVSRGVPMGLAEQSYQQSWSCCAQIRAGETLAPRCPLHCVASGLGSAGTWPGDTSSAISHQDPLLLSKWGHPQTFAGDISALPCVLVAARGQTGRNERAWEGPQGCLTLLWDIIPCPPLLWCLGKGVARVTVPQARRGVAGVVCHWQLPLSAGGHAPPVAGGEPACQRTLCRLRPDLRQRPEAAGLAVSLVQGHRKDVSVPVPPAHGTDGTAPPGFIAGETEAGGLVLRPLALLMHMSLCPQVHSACKELFGKRCPLGQYKVSIIPPTALNSIDSDGESGRDRAGLQVGGTGCLGQGSLSSSAGFDLWHCALFPVGHQKHHLQ